MASGSKIVLDADHSKADQAAERTAGKYRKIGDGAKNVGDEMKKSEKATQGFGERLGKMVFTMAAVARAAKSVTDEIRRQQELAAQRSAAAGGGAIKRGDIIRKAKLEKRLTGGIEAAQAALAGGEAFVEQERIDAFADKLGDTHIRPEQSRRMINLFKTGLYTEKELMTKGRSLVGLSKLSSEQGKRLGNLSALEIQEREVINQRRKQDYSAILNAQSDTTGLRRRLTEIAGEDVEMRNPIKTGIARIVDQVSGGTLNTVEAQRSNATSAQVEKILTSIDAKMGKLTTPRPNGATSVE